MKALYFPEIPLDPEAATHQVRGQAPIMGARVYLSGLFKALLKYSTYDRIFLPSIPHRPIGDPRDSSLFVENRHRIESLNEHQLARLKEYGSSVFLTWSANLDIMTRLRRMSGCGRATITGMIHSLNYSTQLRALLLLLLAPLDTHDALVCSSSAGRAALLKFIDLLGDRLETIGWPRLTARFRLPVIPLGVEVSDFSRGEGKAVRRALDLGIGPLVLYFGRFSAVSKGDLFPLILAFREVSARHPQATLVLAGDDTHFRMADLLGEFARAAAPDARIRIVANPDVETKTELYATADVFVSPSDSLQETFGITVAEAMASGLPTVVSDWDGYKDLVSHGETGFRIRTTLPDYDAGFDDLRGSGTMLSVDLLAATTMIDVAELARALEILVADPYTRRAMGEAARARAQALFDWPVVIGAYEDLWAELAMDASRPRASGPPTALDIEQYGYRDVFSHYATDSLTGDCSVRLTTMASEWDAAGDWLSKSADLTSVLQRERFDSILQELRGEESIQVAALLARLDQRQAIDGVVNMAHLCRLIKYGLVESCGRAVEMAVTPMHVNEGDVCGR